MIYVRNTAPQAMMAEIGQISTDEGLVPETYYDSEGNLTFGFGTLVTSKMPEWELEEGAKISSERCIEAFFHELSVSTIHIPTKVFGYKNFQHFPFDAKRVFFNMSYNLGEDRLSGFVRMIAASLNHDWDTAADELLDSKYRTQVKSRAYRLADRLRALV